ncbi:O-antigen ligase family protein [Halopseudomonas salegens]|uniref:O-Antigen ligase n=1 Tax=Halopseudomonas salegens TaxID=1434072 RepID=A0A1H2EJG6_9GAMM|nr:O-antigen ligase family protein [Halopseudomonas salegens]SDT95286.1 O-Antigen ligase [Halopseudomonas salegens]
MPVNAVRNFPATRYFSWALIVFLAAFVVLPSSKAVNNIYYIFFALPALLLLVAGRWSGATPSLLSALLAAMFSWLLISGLYVDGHVSKDLLYVGIFCLAVYLWVDPGIFDSALLRRSLFWGLVLYVLASVAIYFFSGDYVPGQRVVELPNRLAGSILTSMLIVCFLGLLLPLLLARMSYVELVLAILSAFLVIGFILQSRSGLVGMLVVLAVVFGCFGYKAAWLKRLLLLMLAVAMAGLFVWLLKSSAVAAELLTREDSGRFELWREYWLAWQSCGWFFGCGFTIEDSVIIRENYEIYHPHNIFLTFGFYGGLSTLTLFLLTACCALVVSWRRRDPWFGYLLLALIMLMFDGGSPLGSPDELWLLVWLPIMMIAARERVSIMRDRPDHRIIENQGVQY